MADRLRTSATNIPDAAEMETRLREDAARLSGSALNLSGQAAARVLRDLEAHRANGRELTGETQAWLRGWIQEARISEENVPVDLSPEFLYDPQIQPTPPAVISTKNSTLHVGDFVRVNARGDYVNCNIRQAQGVFVGYVNEDRTRIRVHFPESLLPERQLQLIIRACSSGITSQGTAQQMVTPLQLALRKAQQRARMYGPEQGARPWQARPLTSEQAERDHARLVRMLREQLMGGEEPPPFEYQNGYEPPPKPSGPPCIPAKPVEETRPRRRIIRKRR